MTSSKGKILVVSRDPKLADVRKSVLESAGFSVIPATDGSAVEKACSRGIELIMLGYSLAPSDKRRVANPLRQYCLDIPQSENQNSWSATVPAFKKEKSPI